MDNMTPASTPARKPVGAWVGTVIVILVLALGALYFWGAKLNTDNPDNLPFILGNETSADESWLPESNNSDDAASIEAELRATDMNGFESQTNADMDATSNGL